MNRSSTKSLDGAIPYEKWTGKKHCADHLRVFGSIVHVKATGGRYKKLDERSKPMVFIGYEKGTKAYRCFDPLTMKIHISRDTIFKEGIKWD